MGFLHHILLSTILVATTSGTFTQQKTPVQVDYSWNIASGHVPVATPSGFFGKLGKKNKFAKLSSWLGQKGGWGQKVGPVKAVEMPVWKLHKYKGVELVPMEFSELPNIVGLNFETFPVSIPDYHAKHETGYKIEEPKQEEHYEISWDWNSPDTEWIPFIPEHVTQPAVSSSFTGSNIKKYLPRFNKISKKQKKFNKLRTFRGNKKFQASEPLNLPVESYVHPSEGLYVPSKEEIKYIEHPTVSYAIPVKKTTSAHKEDSEPHYSQQYTNYRTSSSHLTNSYGEPIENNYGSETNQVEIIVPPPSGVHAEKVASEDTQTDAEQNVEPKNSATKKFKKYRKQLKEKPKIEKTQVESA